MVFCLRFYDHVKKNKSEITKNAIFYTKLISKIRIDNQQLNGMELQIINH